MPRLPGTNITILGTFLLVPTRASRSLASRRVIHPSLFNIHTCHAYLRYTYISVYSQTRTSASVPHTLYFYTIPVRLLHQYDRWYHSCTRCHSTRHSFNDTLLYQYAYYTNTTGATIPVPPDDTRQGILSTTRHCRSRTILNTATTHFAFVVCLALALARLPASTRCRRARHAA